MTHLNPESWRRLLAGTLEASERVAVLQHLSESCDDCDEQAAALQWPALDTAVDRALATLAPEPVSASLVFHRTEQRILAAVFPKKKRKWLVAAVPLALAAALAVGVVNPWAVRDGQRTKGETSRPPALTAVVSLKVGNPIELFQAQRTYPNTAELYFTYDLPQDSYVYLGRVGVDGVVEAFYPPLGVGESLEPAGLHSLTVGGTVHAYSLEGLRGKQRFIVLASPVLLQGAAVPQALKEASAHSASLEVEVEGW